MIRDQLWTAAMRISQLRMTTRNRSQDNRRFLAVDPGNIPHVWEQIIRRRVSDADALLGTMATSGILLLYAVEYVQFIIHQKILAWQTW